ncbi:MAG: serine/threonine-protein kinase, partial [Planctomycetota bacterium]|nr:serine/threonine-protein kinase [Planctomycetota bacterium]
MDFLESVTEYNIFVDTERDKKSFRQRVVEVGEQAEARGWIDARDSIEALEKLDLLNSNQQPVTIEQLFGGRGKLNKGRLLQLLEGSEQTICDDRYGLQERGVDQTLVAETADELASAGELSDPESFETSDFGRFRDVQFLAEGGMGRVLTGIDPKVGRQVAIKVLHEVNKTNRIRLAKFRAEARITGQLEHPNIVPVHEVDATSEGTQYFSMKLVRGHPMSAALRKLQESTGPDGAGHDGTSLLRVFQKICDAMAFAHAKGIVHRDLKPPNIMIGAFGEVLVMDWGLAKVLGEPAIPLPGSDGQRSMPLSLEPEAAPTLDGTILGTLPYMSPEQAEGDPKEIDERTDIYSLGVILYEILTLTLPFRGAITAQRNPTTQEILLEICNGMPQPPRQRAPEAIISADLEAVVLRAMHRKKDQRYQSVADLQKDVEAYLEGRTLGAYRYSPLQVLAKWIGRNRRACVAASGVFLAAMILFGGWQWKVYRERQNSFFFHVSSAKEDLREVGSVEDLFGSNVLFDSERGVEVRETLDRRDRRHVALRSYLGSARALEQALQINPKDTTVRTLRLEVGEAIGRMALGGRDYLLAREAFERLDAFGATAAQRDGYLKEVERSQGAL